MLRRFAFATAFGMLFSAVLSGLALAHGAGYRESDLRPISLEFAYSTGTSMSYQEAKVFSPQDEKFAYQSGRTDEGGRFAFTPDVAGAWRVVVKDDEGHLAEAKIDVTPEFMAGQSAGAAPCPVVIPKPAAPEGVDLVLRGGLGVSLLFNLAACVLLLRRRGRNS